MKKMTYAQAREWVKLNLKPIGINTKKKFIDYMTSNGYLPEGFPKSPYYHFKSKHKDPRNVSWISWKDFLSYGEQPIQSKEIIEFDRKYLITSSGEIISNRKSQKGRKLKVYYSKKGEPKVKIRLNYAKYAVIDINQLMQKYFPKE
ncbi:MAG: hypothetical protein CL843_09390 [Crocinitomicaceae bacterium]|nr:hypothetical protein [Crocinitomicaceae bacterium]|tara:strand:- start:142 stop:579 length:438 start_codon:yes stop_codon:yes gene_type:complete